MKDARIRRLALSKETLRNLSPAQLSKAAGGMRQLTFQPFCPPSGATWFAPCETNGSCAPQ